MDDYSESQTGRLSRKISENPFMPLGMHTFKYSDDDIASSFEIYVTSKVQSVIENQGIVGLIMACGFGAYQFKNRGKMSTSVYLMQLRVGAQSAVVGTLTLGVAYTLIKENILKKLD